MAAKKKKKASSVSKLPKSPDYKQAKQSIVRSRVLGLLNEQNRVQQVLQGAFGPPTLRRGGTGVYGYDIRKPKGDPGWKDYYR
jgi:hypothetical protein